MTYSASPGTAWATPGRFAVAGSGSSVPAEPVSAWRISGLLTSESDAAGYRFVGGTPTATVIAQDAAAASWAVTVSLSGRSLVVTVTGAAGKTIRWNADAKLTEIASV